MKTPASFLLLLLLSTCCLTSLRPARMHAYQTLAHLTPDEIAVTKAAEQLRLAMIDPTKEVLMTLTAPELSYGHSAGNIETQADFVNALVSGTSDFVSIDISNQTVTVVENTAVVRHVLLGQIVNKGVPATTKLSVLQVWLKRKGSWVLLARQATKLPQ
ncbi:nuclear transport factor 2 family protein [Fibrella aquatilis]|uniref:Nuclear transport factor 2 family protein n=1 Tax=Fibrella aquatilis TaxID=2817059 RepID=A0A939G736_9BACT|nr:nuclear transport factor 2 family protein [Fibrella aquatilis]MBO0931236.1 nuclear transport factor 2 family protein [Fibrella aquatilis]